MLTKLDILDTIEEIKLGVSYKLDGKVLESMPGEHVCVSVCVSMCTLCAVQSTVGGQSHF